MNRRDFGLWGLDLSTADFAGALAAMGVAAFRVATGFGVDIIQGIIETLEREALLSEEANEPLPWRFPFDLRTPPEQWKLPPARMLADGWTTFRANHRGPLRLMLVEPTNAPWLIEQLSMPEVGLASIFVRLISPESEIRWNWPLRVGFLTDADSQRLREKLQRNRWFQRLWHAVNLDSGQSCDLLLLPFGLRGSLAAVLENKRASAECTLVLGRVKESPGPAAPMLETLASHLNASGIGLAHVRERVQLDWFSSLIDEIAHDEPLDAAIFAANQTVSARPPILFADPRLTHLMRVSKRGELLCERLESVPGDDVRIEISDKAAGDLQLPRGSHPLRILGQRLRARAPHLRWDHEGDGASTMAELARAAKPALEAAPPEDPQPRWIQARVFDCTEAAQPLQLTSALRKNAPHKVEMQIGASREGWIAADHSFPSEQLPENETGHQLTVVFSEPTLLPEPQVATIFLPRAGDSTSCEFFLHTRENTTKIRARLTVVFENRVLQTALVRAPVVADPLAAPPGSKIEATIEAVIRPGMSALNGRTRFDASLVLNHDDDHQAGITKIADNHSSFVAPANLDKEIKWFDDKLSEIADDPDKFAGGLKAEATVDILRDFAKHGSLLYEAIVEDRITDDSIARARRLQVISAEPEARLPIEFLYDREPPDPNAKLCDHAEEALASGKCIDGCPNKDNQSSVVCPLGFWGLNRVIERHAYDKELAATLANSDFTLQAEPVADRRTLNPLAGTLMGASARVDKKTPGGVDSVKAEIEASLKKSPKFVAKWEDWITEIKSGSPSLLVLLVHTEYAQDNLQQIEIGDGAFLEVVYLKENYLRDSTAKPAPLVLLIGCETGAPNLTFHGFVTKLRRSGAAIVVSTGSTILGRHAVPVTRQFVHSLAELSSSQGLSFGDVMLSVRQKLLAQGLLMVLCLMAYGDADWQLRAQ